MAVGDVVYLAEAENDDPTYRLGVVEEVKPGEDGCVRNEADSGEPKGDEPRPANRKRRRRPKKSDKPGVTGREVGGEPQPAAKKRPGRPRKKPAAGSDKNTVKEGGKKQAAQDPGEQQQTPRRGHSRDLAPKGQQDRGRSC